MIWWDKYGWMLGVLSSLMTDEEKEEARRGFVYGNVKLSNNDVTREMVDDAVERMEVG